jgi:hypothetical protein
LLTRKKTNKKNAEEKEHCYQERRTTSRKRIAMCPKEKL